LGTGCPAPGNSEQMLTTHAHLCDGAIIAASRRDPARFAEIFDRHWLRIHRYCVSRAGAAGEDVAAETFRVALDARRRFDCSRDDAGPWLFGIATNLLRSRLRADTRRTRALARLHQHDEADVADGALDRVEAQALGPHVAAALRQLSPIYRDALLLHVWGELSYEQVAEATHVSCCSWAPPASWRSAAAHGRRRAAAHPFRWQSRRRGRPGVVRPRWRRARRWSGWPPTCA
jgi:RNA polymerase sigma factor (sigma-70 family)